MSSKQEDGTFLGAIVPLTNEYYDARSLSFSLSPSSEARCYAVLRQDLVPRDIEATSTQLFEQQGTTKR